MLAALASCAPGKRLPKKETGTTKPKNVVLMVGDGMGLAQLSLTQSAADYMLAIFEWFKVIGLSETASANDYITDSAAGATAFGTGSRTNNGMISVAPDSSVLKTIAEEASEHGKSTGLLATCSITHATPAAFFAHQPSRKMNKEIAGDMYSSGIDVFMGGGWPYFDSSQLVASGFAVKNGLNAFTGATEQKIAGFYSHAEHPPKMSEGRGNYLSPASVQLLELLNRNKTGFFAMIEGSQIDWGGHANDAAYLIEETKDFDKAVRAVLEWAKKDGQTLVIVTADHETGGLTMPVPTKPGTLPKAHFSTGDHSGIQVPVFAWGPGAEQFMGVYKNTDIYLKMKALMGL